MFNHIKFKFKIFNIIYCKLLQITKEMRNKILDKINALRTKYSLMPYSVHLHSNITVEMLRVSEQIWIKTTNKHKSIQIQLK